MSSTSLEKRQPQALATQTETAEPTAVLVPRGDVYETANDVVLVIDMPGVDAEHLEVTVENDLLTLVGRPTLPAPEGFRLGYREYVQGTFRREFRLSSEVDSTQVTAQVKDGVLTLRLPKTEAARARKVAVQQG